VIAVRDPRQGPKIRRIADPAGLARLIRFFGDIALDRGREPERLTRDSFAPTC
jgi:hypothetical protein